MTVTVATATASPAVTICNGSSTILSASGGNAYSWSPGGLTTSSITISPTPVGSYTYTVTVTDLNGCSSTATTKVTVIASPPLPVLTFNGDTICNNSGPLYQWYRNSVLIPGGTKECLYISSDSADFTVIVSNHTGCSDSAASVYNNRTLPVELLSFSAAYNDKIVDLDWSTASEINNDFFTVEKTKDGVGFSPVVYVKSAGTSNQLLYYHASDQSPFEGTSAYRLKQTDFDGKYQYSGLVAVTTHTSGKPEIVALSKDANGTIWQYLISNTNNQPVRIEITDGLGRIIFSNTSSESYGEIDFSDFAHGIYLFRAYSNNEFSYRRFAY
jgi:hypothetical protein